MKRSLAVFLVMILCVCCFSVGVMAADISVEDPVAPESAEAAAAEESGSADAEGAPAQDQAESAPAPEEGPDAEEAEEAADPEEMFAADEAEELQADEETAGEEDAAVEEIAEEPEEGSADEAAEESSDEPGEADAAEEDPALDGAAAAVKPDLSDVDDGWQYVGGYWYYVQDHAAVTGWFKPGSSWFYMDPARYGAMSTGLVRIAGDGQYYFAPTGIMQTGWVEATPEGEYESQWFYFSSSGRSVSGWNKLGGGWYYLDPTKDGAMATGLIRIAGDGQYYLASSGKMQTGWVYTKAEGDSKNEWYYFGSNGSVNGWKKLGGYWYYFDADNNDAMVTGAVSIAGDGRYYFDGSGAMITGWIYTRPAGATKSAWYYYQSSGRGLDGWLKTGSVWSVQYYYLDPNNGGAMATGWNDIDNVRYWMSADGVMATGWLTQSGKYYYFGVNGAMQTGWAYISGNDYYFYKDGEEGGSAGVMAASTTIAGRRIDANGISELPAWDDSMTEDQKIIARAQYYNSPTGNLMIVDRTRCKFYVFSGSEGNWTLKYNWYCTPGSYSTPTPSGTFAVLDTGYYFDSGDARCFWWTQIWGSYCIHSTLYYQNGYSTSTASVMNSTLGYRLSHGCIRLATANAKWVHDNMSVGTTVTIF